MTTDDQQYLTIEQVAERLGSSITNIRRLADLGCFPGTFQMGPQGGGAYRIPKTGLDHFIQTRSVTADTQGS